MEQRSRIDEAMGHLITILHRPGADRMDWADPIRDPVIFPAPGWRDYAPERRAAVARLEEAGDRPGWEPLVLKSREAALLLLPEDGSPKIPYTRDEFQAMLALYKLAAQERLTLRDVALLCAFTGSRSGTRLLLARQEPGVALSRELAEAVVRLANHRVPTPEQAERIYTLL